MMVQQPNIIQWNCRGLRSSREDIELLLNQHSPIALCLQETKLKDGNNQTFRHHNTYYNNTDSGNGGVAIIIKNSIVHSTVTLQTCLQAVAVRLTINDKVYTLCSIYIPPSQNITKSQLDYLYKQLPSPAILMGDFNSHNPLWGSSSFNLKGHEIEKFVLSNDLIIFNTTHPTRFDDYHLTNSTIDLTICHPSVYLDFDCTVFKDRLGSDHYPIQLTSTDTEPAQPERMPQWNLSKADWQTFQALCLSKINTDIFSADSEEMFMANGDKMAAFTSCLLDIASETIPKTSPHPRKKPKPWFNDSCKEIIKQRHAAFRKLKCSPTPMNAANFKHIRAKCRRTLKQQKRASWRQYVSSINSNTKMKTVWEKINKITGKKSNRLLYHLQDNSGESVVGKDEIANELGRHFQSSSSSSNYSPEFQRIKKDKERRKLNFKTNLHFNYNKKFKLHDLRRSLRRSKNSSPVVDQIHYQILKHLPTESLQLFLNLINEYWCDGTFPPSWREALIIPIPKPGKDPLRLVNYRPIALTSCLCKVVERMVNERLIWYLEKNKLLSPYQCGFRNHHSTVDHLV